MSDEITKIFFKPGEEPKTISIPVWWKHGGMMTNRQFLDWKHPESEYQYIINMSLKPEDYGVFKDETELNEVRAMSEEQKVKEILELRETIRGYEKAGF
jgi:hypothetical protein